MEKIILVGAGGHCKSVLDSIKESNQYEIVGIIEKSICNGKVLDVDIIGDDNMLKSFYESGINNAFITVGSIGDVRIRRKIYNNLKSIGFKIPVIIDKTAVVSKYAEIEEGVFIGKGAVVNANAIIKSNAIINTGAIVEHDCVIGEFAHLSPRSTLCGEVEVGSNTHIGASAIVIQGIKIGENSIVGAGSVIVKDVEEQQKVFGNPGRKR